ncbi:MAG: hypothetical protein HRU19_00080 [Pseudobacteriovorax sp.]|nr:hypothetical protein [Pseudobacteriovorax sp.]
MSNRKHLAGFILKAVESLTDETSRYQWGHMSQCNVGHLVQAITGMKDTEIIESVDEQLIEWTDYASGLCPVTHNKIDDIFDTLRQYGFQSQDVIHLENLSDRKVLQNLPGGFRYLRRNHKDDVIAYMESLADLLSKAA